MSKALSPGAPLFDVPLCADEMEDIIKTSSAEQLIALVSWITTASVEFDKIQRLATEQFGKTINSRFANTT